MSLSTLEAQLAALSGSAGKHPGSNLGAQSASKRHSEAIGRGWEHSVQHGYAVPSSSSKKYQASLLHTPQQASDIPLTVLQENCQQALVALAEEYGLWSLRDDMIPAVCGRDEASSKQIQSLLVYLTFLLGETINDGGQQQNCLHVLEYLLRRYRVHVTLMEDLLWTVLPHSESVSWLFHRVLQLVDLASISAYTWLRPYAADPKQEAASMAVILLPRALLAQHVMRDGALLRRFLQQTQAMVDFHQQLVVQQTNLQQQMSSLLLDPRGLALFLSWSAAVLVQGLSWTTTTADHRIDSEAVLRTLLPFILSACAAQNYEDWTAWGYVVASACAECMEWSHETIALVTRHILQHAVQADDNDDGRAADGLIAALSILQLPVPSSQQQQSEGGYLPLINGKCVGCLLPLPTFQALRQYDSTVLGHVHRDRRIVVAPLVAAIFVTGLRDDNDNDDNTLTEWLQSLVEEAGLQSLWKDPRMDLTASLAAYIVSCSLQENGAIIERSQSLLRSLHQMDPRSCERGIAHAIQQQDTSCTLLDRRLAELLEGIVAVPTQDDPAEQELAQLLPPRVALEHADASVRLQAIHRLVSIESNDDNDEEEELDAATTGGESLAESLLRRWSMDEDVDVALAAAKALCDEKRMESLEFEEGNGPRMGEMVLSGLYHWINEATVQPNSANQLLLEKSVAVASHAARELGLVHGERSKEFWHLILEALANCLDFANEAIANQAAIGLVYALDECSADEKKKNSDSKLFARICLANDERFLQGIQKLLYRRVGPSADIEKLLRRRCCRTILAEMAESLSDETRVTHEMASNVMSLCLSLLEEREAIVDQADYQVMKKCLERSASSLVETGDGVWGAIVSLASIPSQHCFVEVVSPVVRSLSMSVRDSDGKPVSALAVLLEAAVRLDTPSLAAERLVLLAAETVSAVDSIAPWFGVLPSLALLEHSNGRVRTAAVKLFHVIAPEIAKTDQWAPLSHISAHVADAKSSAALGGDFLPGFLSSCVRSSPDARYLSETLLKLCVFSAACVGQSNINASADAFAHCWLTIDAASGGCRVASVILQAVELAGEEAFPLSTRWSVAGRTILEGVLSSESVVVPSYLMEVVVRMLKGVMVSDPQIIVSSGPRAGGGRARAYSVGKMDGTTFIEPYPRDMLELMVRLLTGSKGNTSSWSLVASIVVRNVLTSKSWGEGVFKKMERPNRLLVGSALLSYIGDATDEISEEIFAAVPFDAVDVCALLKKSGKHVPTIQSLSILTNFIRTNAESVVESRVISDVVSLLFQRMATISVGTCNNDDGEFICQSILLALAELWKPVDGENKEKIKVDEKNLKGWVDNLLVLLGDCKTTDSSGHGRLKSFRSRSAALSLLTGLCSAYPELVVSSLLSAIDSAILLSCEGSMLTRLASETFTSLVPVFRTHAHSAGLNLFDLFVLFIEAVGRTSSEHRSRLYRDLSQALLVGSTNSFSGAPIAALLASFLAVEAHAAKGDDLVNSESVTFVVQILDSAPPSVQMASLLFFLHYGKILMLLLVKESVGSSLDFEDSRSLPTPVQLARLATNGLSSLSTTDEFQHSSRSQRHSVVILVKAMLQAFGDSLLLDSVQKCMRKGDGRVSELSLHLWQELLVAHAATQSTSGHTHDEEPVVSCLSSVARSLLESREVLQRILPAHIFLASVSSLIRDGGNDDIRAHALRLVADRVIEVAPQDPEALLFQDLLPDIADLLRSRTIAVQQSALLALEHIASSVARWETDDREKSSEYMLHAVTRCGELLKECKTATNFMNIEPTSRQLICSIALCCSTLVRAVGARCLANLSDILKPLVSALSSANMYISDCCTGDLQDEENEALSEARVLQLSIVRSFVAIVEAAPQFVSPYLHLLLTESALLSSSLRTVPNKHYGTVRAAVEQLDRSLSSKVAPRLLIPATSAATQRCSEAVGLHALLVSLKISVEKASRIEAVAQKGNVLKAVTTACDFEAAFSHRHSLVEASTDLLLTLVMKLSEVQLRRMFVSFCEWRGSLQTQNPDSFASRRFAFWTLSAALVKELRSIFLPCLSMVFDEALKELELAVSRLTKRRASKTALGHKKRRLDSGDEEGSYGEESMRCIQPILLCLEHSLRADARDGGSWVRADENQRYNLILEPLGLLLQCRVPSNFPVPNDSTNGFQYLVHGADNVGNVVNCLTALAAAAGNEQLWKSLNHAVLDACGNDEHPEARRAGVLCLLSLMQSLGEEYMVLLPECLPILSELLEDMDEEIVEIARDCVALAEELIGESLEDSLR